MSAIQGVGSPGLKRPRTTKKKHFQFTEKQLEILEALAAERAFSVDERVDKAMLLLKNTQQPKLKSHVRSYFRKAYEFRTDEEISATNWCPIEQPEKMECKTLTGEDSSLSDFAKYKTIRRSEGATDYSVHETCYLRYATLQQLLQLLCHPFRSCEGIEKGFLLTFPLLLKKSDILGTCVEIVTAIHSCEILFIEILWYEKVSIFLLRWMDLHFTDWQNESLFNDPGFLKILELLKARLEKYQITTKDDSDEPDKDGPSWLKVVGEANPVKTLSRRVQQCLDTLTKASQSGGVGVGSLAQYLEQEMMKWRRRLCVSGMTFDNLRRKYDDDQIPTPSTPGGSPSLERKKKPSYQNFMRTRSQALGDSMGGERAGQRNSLAGSGALGEEFFEVDGWASVKPEAGGDGICMVCGKSGSKCTECGETFCQKCSQLPAFKNMCNHAFPVANGSITTTLEGGESCGRCGADEAREFCTVCQTSFCENCAKLPPLKNLCSTGTKHMWRSSGGGGGGGKGRVGACSRCGEEDTVVAKCENCQNDYCLRCARLPVLKNSCPSGMKHVFPASELPQQEKEKKEKNEGGGGEQKEVVVVGGAKSSRGPATSPLSASSPLAHKSALSPVAHASCSSLTSSRFRIVPRAEAGGQRGGVEKPSPSLTPSPLPEPLLPPTPTTMGIGEESVFGSEDNCVRCGENNCVRKCNVCSESFCARCSALPAFKNMCSNGSKHTFGDVSSSALQTCGRCGDESTTHKQCSFCQDFFCQSCVNRPRNVCSSGLKHVFENNNEQKEVKVERKSFLGAQKQEAKKEPIPIVPPRKPKKPPPSLNSSSTPLPPSPPSPSSSPTTPILPPAPHKPRKPIAQSLNQILSAPPPPLSPPPSPSLSHISCPTTPPLSPLGSPSTSPATSPAVSPAVSPLVPPPIRPSPPPSPQYSSRSSPPPLSSPLCHSSSALSLSSFERIEERIFGGRGGGRIIDTKTIDCYRCGGISIVCCAICEKVFCSTCQNLSLKVENCLSGEAHSFPQEQGPAIKHKLGKIHGATHKRLRALRNQKIISSLKTLQENESFKPKKCPRIDIDKIDTEHFAMQLCLLHYILMDRIPPREYVFWVVSKDKKSDCPHMIELVDHFNWLSNWVTTEIVTRIHLADRTKLFVQLIEVLVKLIRERNFFGAMSVVGAIQSAAVHRMKKTLNSIDDAWQTKYDEILDVLPVTNSLVNYRKALNESPNSTTVPYLGSVSKDILFTNDGNSDYRNTNMINWGKKFAKIAEMVFSTKESMTKIYDVDADEHLLTLLIFEADVISEEEAFSWSRRSEPKDFEVIIEELISSETKLTKEVDKQSKKIEEQEQEIERLKKELEETRAKK